jgi:hypothetical protein
MLPLFSSAMSRCRRCSRSISEPPEWRTKNTILVHMPLSPGVERRRGPGVVLVDAGAAAADAFSS